MPPLARPDSNWCRKPCISSSLIAEIGPARGVVPGDDGGRAAHHDASRLYQIGVISEFEGDVGILLDQQHRDAFVTVDGAQDSEDFLRDERRETERWLPVKGAWAAASERGRS